VTANPVVDPLYAPGFTGADLAAATRLASYAGSNEDRAIANLEETLLELLWVARYKLRMELDKKAEANGDVYSPEVLGQPGLTA